MEEKIIFTCFIINNDKYYNPAIYYCEKERIEIANAQFYSIRDQKSSRFMGIDGVEDEKEDKKEYFIEIVNFNQQHNLLFKYPEKPVADKRILNYFFQVNLDKIQLFLLVLFFYYINNLHNRRNILTM